MGYCAHSEESTAFVSSDRVDALIEAAKKSNHDLPSDVDLEDIARAYGFTAEPYDNDTKFTFYFEYGSFYIEVVEDFCSLIAPFVEPGGYISFRGEDDASWRIISTVPISRNILELLVSRTCHANASSACITQSPTCHM